MSRQQALAAVRSVCPCLIFVPGGAWAIGYKAWGAAFARSLAAAGIRVICPDHRNFPQARISGQVSDIDAAIEHVQVSLLQEHGGDRAATRYLYVCGQSAGAHLAACAVLERAVRYARHMNGPRAGHATARAPPPIRRYIGISGPYDVLGMVTAMAKRGISMDALHSLFEGDMERFSPSRYVALLSSLGPWEEGGGPGTLLQQEQGQEGSGEGQETVTQPGRATVPDSYCSSQPPVPPSPVRLVLPLLSPRGSPSPVQHSPGPPRYEAARSAGGQSTRQPGQSSVAHGVPYPLPPDLTAQGGGGSWYGRVRRLTYDATSMAEEVLESTEADCRHRGEDEGERSAGLARVSSYTRLFSLPVSRTGGILSQGSDNSDSEEEMGEGQGLTAEGGEEMDTLEPLDMKLHASNPGPVEATAPLSSVVQQPHVQLGSPTGFASPRGQGRPGGTSASASCLQLRGTGCAAPRTAGQDIISSLPPITLLHGAADDTVEAAMSLVFAAQLHKAGVRCCEEEGQEGIEGKGTRAVPCTHSIRVRMFASATHTDPVLEGALSAGAPQPAGRRTDSTHILYAAVVHGVGVLFRWLWLLLRLLCLPVTLPWRIGRRLAWSGTEAGWWADRWWAIGELGSHASPGPLYSVTHPHIAQHEDAGLGSGDALIEDIVSTIARDVLADNGLLEPVLQAWRETQHKQGQLEGRTCGRMDQSHAPLPSELIDLSHARALAPPLASAWLCALARKVNPF